MGEKKIKRENMCQDSAMFILSKDWKGLTMTSRHRYALKIGAAAVHAMEVLEASEGDITSIGFMDAVAKYRDLTGYRARPSDESRT